MSEQVTPTPTPPKNIFADIWSKLAAERLLAPVRAAMLGVQRTRYRTRPRIHFGENSRYENKIEHTFTRPHPKGPKLYFKFASGQVVRADRKHTNPEIRRLVRAEVEVNSKRG